MPVRESKYISDSALARGQDGETGGDAARNCCWHGITGLFASRPRRPFSLSSFEAGRYDFASEARRLAGGRLHHRRPASSESRSDTQLRREAADVMQNGALHGLALQKITTRPKAWRNPGPEMASRKSRSRARNRAHGDRRRAKTLSRALDADSEAAPVSCSQPCY